MRPRTVQILSGAVFALIALMHLLRVLAQAPATVGGWQVPQAASVVAVVVAGGLAVLNLAAACRP